MFLHHLRPEANRGVGVAFTDRFDGPGSGPMGTLNLGRTDTDDPAVVAAGFRQVADALGVGHVAATRQTHGSAVHHVRAAFDWPPGAELGDSLPGGERLPEADALVTDQPGVALCIRVADCVPVVLADAAAGVAAAAHAGRVGLAGGVLQATIDAMHGLGARRITAWIGPRICGPCYEVPDAMAAEVAAAVPGVAARTREGTAGLDLGAGSAAVLVSAGVTVHDVGVCTRETPSLYSHRRDGAAAGRLGAFVWMA